MIQCDDISTLQAPQLMLMPAPPAHSPLLLRKFHRASQTQGILAAEDLADFCSSGAAAMSRARRSQGSSTSSGWLASAGPEMIKLLEGVVCCQCKHRHATAGFCSFLPFAPQNGTLLFRFDPIHVMVRNCDVHGLFGFWNAALRPHTSIA